MTRTRAVSILSKIFGRKSWEEERARGVALLAEGERGLAKLAFERALERAGEQPPEIRAELSAKVAECCDGIAESRMAEAERLLSQGELDLALAELEGAAETAASAEVKAEAERRAEAAVRKDARAQAEVVAPLGEEARFETLSGHWEDSQYRELTGQGEALKRALLAAHEGESAAALQVLEEHLARAEAPCYLLYEVGRLRLVEGDLAGGREALARFVAALPEGAGGEARLSAHMELAQLHHDAGEFDEAVAQYGAAVEAMPEDTRPYLAMGAFLRREGHADEALEVLESARAIDGREHPHWMLAEQLGLVYADLSRDAAAIALLEDALSQLAARGQRMLPVEGTVRLCTLHEKAGNLARAVDLRSLLASAEAAPDRFGHQLEAARLLQELGLTREARQMLQRATEIAPDDAAAHERLARVRASIDPTP